MARAGGAGGQQLGRGQGATRLRIAQAPDFLPSLAPTFCLDPMQGRVGARSAKEGGRQEHCPCRGWPQPQGAMCPWAWQKEPKVRLPGVGPTEEPGQLPPRLSGFEKPERHSSRTETASWRGWGAASHQYGFRHPPRINRMVQMLHNELFGKKKERGGRSRGGAFASPSVARRATSVAPLSSESGKTRSHAGTLRGGHAARNQVRSEPRHSYLPEAWVAEYVNMPQSDKGKAQRAVRGRDGRAQAVRPPGPRSAAVRSRTPSAGSKPRLASPGTQRRLRVARFAAMTCPRLRGGGGVREQSWTGRACGVCPRGQKRSKIGGDGCTTPRG